MLVFRAVQRSLQMSGTLERPPSRVCRFVDRGQLRDRDSRRVSSWLPFGSRPSFGSRRLTRMICCVLRSAPASKHAAQFKCLGAIAVLVLVSIGNAAAQAVPPASWLDRPVAGWNKPGLSVAKAPRFD